ncbi:HAD hydrolase family protein [Virgibacillus oceani]
MVSSAKHNFELKHKMASKGIALEILSNKLAIKLDDTTTFGDSFNDLSML